MTIGNWDFGFGKFGNWNFGIGISDLEFKITPMFDPKNRTITIINSGI